MTSALEYQYPEYDLAGFGYEAKISPIGATVRELTYQGRDLIVSFDPAQIRPLYRGALVAPWPNRIADGKYSLAGTDYQLAINEVDRHHALHGLICWEQLEVVDVGAAKLTLRHHLVPQEGYPFPLRIDVSFELTAQGLVTSVDATNTGTAAAPYGVCPHPYLVAGSESLDEWTLSMPADSRVEVDDVLIPIGHADVADVDSDYRQGAQIGSRKIDHAFTGLSASDDGRFRVRVTSGGSGVEMSWGAWGSWVQIHTADRPEAHNNRVGLAVEPMSCAPNAFNEQGFALLEPGLTHHAEWTIAAI
ncbi:galactose mutarotase [Nakamurella antarctica]|uniref:Galactose mutarotase n=1 Tax=Nakamurella antarctica TaxID=1902245 RepID=A0A3G8ZMW7_9ACTN|nr:aldose 1-epimerase family protein [Nakamurella antarctica]AZI58488.1 galactose mutarotase [Nakamurella antarctica]